LINTNSTSSSTDLNRYDAIIIGAGHNGLVCATYLAKAGLRVLVLEQHDIIGGACITESLFPECRVSTAACWYGMLRPQIIGDLNLYDYGLEPYPMDPQILALYPDGRHLFIWLDDNRTTEEIAHFSLKYAQNDIPGYIAFNIYIDRVLDIISPLLLDHPISFEQISHLFTNKGLPQVYEEVFNYSVADLLNKFFQNEELKAALAFSATAISNTSPFTEKTAFDLIYMLAAETAGNKKAWGFVKGGMGNITTALARAAHSHNVEIRTGSKVKQIMVEDHKAIGVVVNDSIEIRSNIIVSNADPKHTFTQLLSADHLNRSFIEQVNKIQMNGCSSILHLLLSGLPQFKGFAERSIGDQHRGMIVIAPSMQYIDRAWRQAKEGKISDNPILTMSMQSITDETIAPPGKHILSVYVQFTPYQLAHDNWTNMKDILAEKVISTIEQYIPNIRDILVDIVVFTPQDLENKIGITGGHAEHGDMTIHQMFENRPIQGWAEYHTPVDGLYLCSAGTHPGGTVTGAPGFNAAHTILSDLNLNKA
jgi:phytoene dehydrogenase-like protein